MSDFVGAFHGSPLIDLPFLAKQETWSRILDAFDVGTYVALSKWSGSIGQMTMAMLAMRFMSTCRIH